MCTDKLVHNESGQYPERYNVREGIELFSNRGRYFDQAGYETIKEIEYTSRPDKVRRWYTTIFQQENNAEASADQIATGKKVRKVSKHEYDFGSKF
jgi:hypothetical protein